MKPDVEIAQEAKMLPITAVAKSLGICEDDIDPYGKYKAKIDPAQPAAGISHRAKILWIVSQSRRTALHRLVRACQSGG